MLYRVSALAVVLALTGFVSVQAEERATAKGDIVDVAVGAGKFKTLVAAVKAAELVDALKGKGPFTVFAPTDKAFEALGEDTINALLKDKEKLKAILTYHVVSGRVLAKDAIALAKDEKSAKTLNGAAIKLSLDGKNLMLNGKAKVITADVQTSNGVIHIIDAVILPPSE